MPRRRTKPANRQITVDISTINPAFWTQGFSVDPVAFEELSVVNGSITCANPDYGPNNSASFGAYHGCAYHDFGAGWADNFEIIIEFSMKRPMEATPLMHVNPATTAFGCGLWPGYPATATGYWAAGEIGNSNANFVIKPTSRLFTAAENLSWSLPWRVHPPTSFTMRCANGKYTFKMNETWLPNMTFDVPASLVGSTTHGFAIDGNQLDGVMGAGGFRPANWPAITANTFTIRKL